MPRYSERKILPYAPEQLFDLVADIEQYPEFLPWCLDARILKRDGEVAIADLVIGWKVIREKFTSRVTLKRPDEVQVEYIDGPMKYMRNHWRFASTPSGQCEIDFLVDFEFKSKSLQLAMGVLFNEAAHRMVSAFEKRARQKLKPVRPKANSSREP